MKINQVLRCGAPDQVPLIVYQHLDDIHPVSVLGWPRQISIDVLCTFGWKSIRFVLEADQITLIVYKHLNEHQSDSALACS